MIPNELLLNIAQTMFDKEKLRIAVGQIVPYVLKVQGAMLSGGWTAKLQEAREGSSEEFKRMAKEYAEALSDATTDMLLADVQKELDELRREEEVTDEHES